MVGGPVAPVVAVRAAGADDRAGVPDGVGRVAGEAVPSVPADPSADPGAATGAFVPVDEGAAGALPVGPVDGAPATDRVELWAGVAERFTGGDFVAVLDRVDVDRLEVVGGRLVDVVRVVVGTARAGGAIGGGCPAPKAHPSTLPGGGVYPPAPALLYDQRPPG